MISHAIDSQFIFSVLHVPRTCRVRASRLVKRDVRFQAIENVVMYHSFCLVTALARTSPLFLLSRPQSPFLLYITLYHTIYSSPPYQTTGYEPGPARIARTFYILITSSIKHHLRQTPTKITESAYRTYQNAIQLLQVKLR